MSKTVRPPGGATVAPAEPSQGPSRGRSVGVGAARVLVVAAAAAGLVWGAGQVSASDTLDVAPAAAARHAVVSAAPAGTRSVCSGPVTPGSTAQVAALARSNAVGDRLAATAAPGGSRLDGTGQASRGGVRVRLDQGRSAVLQVPDADAVTAAQSSLDNDTGGKGLSTAACVTPRAGAYLVAGGAGSGRVVRVNLVNPGANPVPVRLTVLGGDAPQELALPGGGRTVVTVPVGSVQAPVVRVEARSGTVAAFVSDVQFAGATAQGTDLSASAVAPTRKSVIPAVRVAQGGGAAVRIAVPGSREAVVRLRILAEGTEAPQDVVRTVPAGRGTDIPLVLPDGQYAVAVSADEPVVAAGESRTWSGTGAGDRMWSPAVAAGTRQVSVAVPQGPPAGASALVLSAPSDREARVRVTVIDAGGGAQDRTIQVPAGGVRTVQVAGAGGYWVRPATPTPIAAALVSWGRQDDRALLSTVSLTPAGATTTLQPELSD